MTNDRKPSKESTQPTMDAKLGLSLRTSDLPSTKRIGLYQRGSQLILELSDGMKEWNGIFTLDEPSVTATDINGYTSTVWIVSFRKLLLGSPSLLLHSQSIESGEESGTHSQKSRSSSKSTTRSLDSFQSSWECLGASPPLKAWRATSRFLTKIPS